MIDVLNGEDDVRSDGVKSIETRTEFAKLAMLLGVRPDWHEPDEQEVTARVSGTLFDNAGFWPHPETYRSISVEKYVTIAQGGVDVAHVNLATLCAWASDDRESYWRMKIADEIRVLAKQVRAECYTKSAGVALAALVESVADQIDARHVRADDTTPPPANA